MLLLHFNSERINHIVSVASRMLIVLVMLASPLLFCPYRKMRMCFVSVNSCYSCLRAVNLCNCHEKSPLLLAATSTVNLALLPSHACVYIYIYMYIYTYSYTYDV